MTGGADVTCADNRAVLPGLRADSVAHLVTDPPYSAHVHSKQWQGHALTADGAPRCATAHAELGFAAIEQGDREFIAAQAARLVTGWSLIFTDLEGLAAWREAVEGAGLEWVRACIWDKVDGAPQFTGDRPANGAEAIAVAHRPGKKRWNGGGKRNVYRHAVNGERGPKPHPSTKPLALMLELLADFTDPGDLILDPFCGSGTTCVAALRLGRSFIGIEREDKWAEVARERLRAEESGSSLLARRAGQCALFGGGGS